jgi:type I restriction enzyme S subunit
MSTTKGYKKTEVGVLPEDWEVKRIDQIITVKGGGTPSTTVKTYWGGDVNWFTPTEVGKSKYLDQSVRSITEIGLKNSSAMILPKGTILLTSRAGIGDLGILKKEAATNQGFQSLICNAEVNNEFIYYLMLTKKGELLQNASGSTFLEISPSKVKSIKIPLPPLTEQIAIASALSDMDALISQTEKLIEKKKSIKQGMMQELLTGRTRIQGFGHQQGYKQTEVGVIPEDWEVKRLGELGENIIGLTYSPNDVKDYGHLVLRSSNIQNNRLSFENNVFVKMELPNRVIVRENDILICVRNGSKHLIGKCALIDKATEGSAFGAFMSIYRTSEAKYVFHQFQSNIIQKQIEEVMGATINQLTNKDLATFKIPLPSNRSEQTAIASALSDMDQEITVHESKLQKLKLQKQGMMQALLTGKIRLI